MKKPFNSTITRQIVSRLRLMKEEASSIFPMYSLEKREEIIENRRQEIGDLSYPADNESLNRLANYHVNMIYQPHMGAH